MKVRKLKRIAQEKHGHMDTKSFRLKTLDYNPFTGEEYYGPMRTYRVSISQGNGKEWKENGHAK